MKERRRGRAIRDEFAGSTPLQAPASATSVHAFTTTPLPDAASEADYASMLTEAGVPDHLQAEYFGTVTQIVWQFIALGCTVDVAVEAMRSYGALPTADLSDEFNGDATRRPNGKGRTP